MKTHEKCRLHRIHLSQTRAGWCDFAMLPLHHRIRPVEKPPGWQRRRVKVAGKNGTPACHLSPPQQDWVDVKQSYSAFDVFVTLFFYCQIWVCTLVSSRQCPTLLCNQCAPCPLSNCHHIEIQGAAQWWRERGLPHGHWCLHLLGTPHAKESNRDTRFLSSWQH